MNVKILIISLLPIAAIGCRPSSTVVETQVPAAIPANDQPVPEVQLKYANWEETEELVAAHRGKVVVLDVWSSWCVPCLKEFPNLVKLHQQQTDRVICMSLNCNYVGIVDQPPDEARTAVESFLRKQGAIFENVICTDTDEQLFMKLDAASIPIVRVYDKQGKLAKQFVNDQGEYGEDGFTYARHILPLVESLLD